MNDAFPDKYLKKLPTGFTDNMDAADTKELKKVIVESEGNIYTIDKAAEADHKLNGAKDLVKELSSSYREAKGCQTSKIKYCLWLMENRGENLDNKDVDDDKS